jgi:hypothetical protein
LQAECPRLCVFTIQSLVKASGYVTTWWMTVWEEDAKHIMKWPHFTKPCCLSTEFSPMTSTPFPKHGRPSLKVVSHDPKYLSLGPTSYRFALNSSTLWKEHPAHKPCGTNNIQSLTDAYTWTHRYQHLNKCNYFPWYEMGMYPSCNQLFKIRYLN